MQQRSTTAAACEKPARRWPAIACLILYWLALCLATHLRNPWPAGGTPTYPDKLVHFTAYGILAALAVFALIGPRSSRGRGSLVRRAAVIWCAVVVYGLLDEFTQPLTGRDFEWLDWAADIGGATCGTLLATLWRWRGGRIASRWS